MKIVDLLDKRSVKFGVNAKSKEDAIRQICHLMAESGKIDDVENYISGVLDREDIATTGVGNFIAMPHCQGDFINSAGLAVMKFNEGVNWDSLDGEPVKLAILIAAPQTSDNLHLDVLAKLSGMLMHDDFREGLLNAKDEAEFYQRIVDADKEEEEKAAEDNTNINPEGPLILAVTACPTGVAHTYMAKESLETKAKELNINLKVETDGSGGIKNELTDEDIKKAKAIIVAADAFVQMGRFNGKPVIEVPVSKAIGSPDVLLNSAVNDNIPKYKAGASEVFQIGAGDGRMEGSSKAHNVYKHLMSGISHMIPFVVAGGILLAFAYMIDGLCGSPKDGLEIDGIYYAFGSINEAARVLHDLGATFGLGLMLPVLGGFIAYSIAGKPGLVSGFVGSFAATQGMYSALYYYSLLVYGVDADSTLQLATSSAGFIGAIAAGFIAGYFVKFLQRKFSNFSRTLEPVRDMLIIPLISTAFVGACMFLLNAPFGLLNIYLGIGLQVLKDANLILLLAALVSALMATDMGGPINKATHYFVLSLVTTSLGSSGTPEMQTLACQLMAANIVGIMVPPVGIAIATWLFPQKFTAADRVPSLANFFIGLSGITEGAIPYVAISPVIFIFCCMTGAAVGGVISMLLGMEAIAPEGGTISYLVMGASC